MHMADALLAPAVAATMYAVSGVTAGVSVKTLRKDEETAKLPVMAVTSALVFAGQMVNYTIPGTGSSGHMCGGMMLTALLGPQAGFLSMITILLIQALFFADGGKVLIRIWKITITDEGLFRAMFMVLRILLLISGTFLMTYTTSPIALTDGLEALLNPLKKIHVPVHELSMMMCIALRFIPTLIEDTDKIMSAQKARGADFENGTLIERAKALIPILVPLFISAFRRADELATAMECRCYQGGEGRTKLKQLRYHRIDFNGFVVGALLIAVVCILRVFGI